MIAAASDDNCSNDTMVLQPASFFLPTSSYPLLWGDCIIQGETVGLQVKNQGRLLEIQEKGRSSLSLLLIDCFSFLTRDKLEKCRLYCSILSLLVFSTCDTFLSKSTSFSLHDNLLSNLPQTGLTLSWLNSNGLNSFLTLTCCMFLLFPLDDRTYFKSLFPFPHACQADTFSNPSRQFSSPSRAWKPLFRQAASPPDPRDPCIPTSPAESEAVGKAGNCWARNFTQRKQSRNLELALCSHRLLSSSLLHSAKEMCWVYRIPTCSMLEMIMHKMKIECSAHCESRQACTAPTVRAHKSQSSSV